MGTELGNIRPIIQMISYRKATKFSSMQKNKNSEIGNDSELLKPWGEAIAGDWAVKCLLTYFNFWDLHMKKEPMKARNITEPPIINAICSVLSSSSRDEILPLNISAFSSPITADWNSARKTSLRGACARPHLLDILWVWCKSQHEFNYPGWKS